MPSRMSCSQATTAVCAGALHDDPQDQRARPDHVGPARVHHRQRQPLGDGRCRAGRRSPAPRRRTRSGRGGCAPRRTPGRSRASAATVVTEPARPTSVRRAAAGHRRQGGVDRRGDVRLRRRDLGRRRRVAVQVPLGHPDAADVHRDRVLDLGGRRRRTRSSRRRCPRPGTAARRSGRCTAPAKESRASSSPVITSGSTPSTPRTMARKSAALDASREAEVAHIRTRVDAQLGDLRRVAQQGLAGALDRRAGRAGRCGRRPRPAGRSPSAGRRR